MQVKKAAVKLCLALAVIVPCMAWGQTSSINDFGLEGQCFYNSQKYYGQTLNTSYYTVNFHDIAFQLPIAKHLGLGFSLTPYSSVGYRMKQEVDDDEIWGNIGRVQYQWDGDGDVTEVKLGLGWEIFRGFSIGIAAQYYWGDIQRIYKTAILENITGGGLIADATGTETYSVSRFKGQFGVQWSPISNRRRILTIGATYDIGGDLNPNVTTKVQTGDIFNTVAMDMGNRLGLKLPQQVAVGIYYNTPKIAVGADYVYQDWRSGNSRLVEKSAAGFDVAYRNTNTVKLGVEYTPNKADLGVEVGGRGSFKAINEQVSLVKQTYCKFSLGVTLFGDYWFVRPKYD